jgi:phosphosulfolactate synthase (CoM biosynthesis protein A)
VDTDLTRGFDLLKSNPDDIVRQALDGLDAGADEVLADALTKQVKQGLTAPRSVYLAQAQ